MVGLLFWESQYVVVYIIQVLEYEHLNKVMLVDHSYGG
jgi:hypothetical protein